MELKDFISKYSVHFGPLPADMEDKVQLNEWGDLISRINPDRVDAIIGRVSLNMGKGNKKPRIRDFKVAMLEVEEPHVQYSNQGCERCNGTGYLTVLGWVDSSKPFYDRSRYKIGHLGNNSRLYRIAAPCKCPKGRSIAQNNGFHPECIEKYHAWYDGFMGECKLLDKSPSFRMTELVTESVKMYGVWPVPSELRKAIYREDLPQEVIKRPIATVACPPVDRSSPITADDSGPNW